MDALLVMVLALFLTVKTLNEPEEKKDVLLENEVSAVNRIAKINDSYYEDKDAFSEIIHALGFPKETK